MTSTRRLAATICAPWRMPLSAARTLQVPQNAYEMQMLYGMAEPERRVLRAMGQRVRVYAPSGRPPPRHGLPRPALAGKYGEHWLFTPEFPRRTRATHPAGAAKARAGASTGQLASRPRDLTHALLTTVPWQISPTPKTHQAFALAIERTSATLPQTRAARHRWAETLYRPHARTLLSEPYRPACGQRHPWRPRRDAATAVATAVQAWPAWRDRPLLERASYLTTSQTCCTTTVPCSPPCKPSRSANPGGKPMPM